MMGDMMGDMMEQNESVPQEIAPVAPKPRAWRNGPRRKHTPEFKLKVIKEYENGASAKSVANKYKISDTLVHNWRKLYLRTGKFTEGNRNQYPANRRKPTKVAKAVAPTAAAPAAERTEGRLDLYIKSDRTMLLSVIGELYLETRKLKSA